MGDYTSNGKHEGCEVVKICTSPYMVVGMVDLRACQIDIRTYGGVLGISKNHEVQQTTPDICRFNHTRPGFPSLWILEKSTDQHRKARMA